jgi:hypothetical protein
MHTTILIASILAWDTRPIAWCPAHSLPDRTGDTDLVLPNISGFTYNTTMVYRTPSGGWQWDTGLVEPAPGGGSWGYGWDTIPAGALVAAEVMPLRPHRDPIFTTIPLVRVPHWSD